MIESMDKLTRAERNAKYNPYGELPEPRYLWKWCSGKTKREGYERQTISMHEWRERAVWDNCRVAGETHPDFTKRAMIAYARKQISERRRLKLFVPERIEELLAGECGNV